MSKNENKCVLSPKVFFVSNLNMFFSISGDGDRFQIRVTTTEGNQGLAGTGFDLVYAQVGC